MIIGIELLYKVKMVPAFHLMVIGILCMKEPSNVFVAFKEIPRDALDSISKVLVSILRNLVVIFLMELLNDKN